MYSCTNFVHGQAYSGAQALQIIILLSSGTNKGGGYFAPKSVFLGIYVFFILVWAVLNSFALKVIAYLNIISIWWQVQDSCLTIKLLVLLLLLLYSRTVALQNLSNVMAYCKDCHNDLLTSRIHITA